MQKSGSGWQLPRGSDVEAEFRSGTTRVGFIANVKYNGLVATRHPGVGRNDVIMPPRIGQNFWQLL